MTQKMNAVEKLLAELCPEGVEFKELGEIVRNITSGGTPSTARTQIMVVYPLAKNSKLLLDRFISLE
jgi:hypothetical protein